MATSSVGTASSVSSPPSTGYPLALHVYAVPKSTKRVEGWSDVNVHGDGHALHGCCIVEVYYIPAKANNVGNVMRVTGLASLLHAAETVHQAATRMQPTSEVALGRLPLRCGIQQV